MPAENTFLGSAVTSGHSTRLLWASFSVYKGGGRHTHTHTHTHTDMHRQFLEGIEKIWICKEAGPGFQGEWDGVWLKTFSRSLDFLISRVPMLYFLLKKKLTKKIQHSSPLSNQGPFQRVSVLHSPGGPGKRQAASVPSPPLPRQLVGRSLSPHLYFILKAVW